MLPTTQIDLSKICARAFDMSRGRQAFLGYAFAYCFSQVEELAQERQKSIDRVLMEFVLAGMTGWWPRYQNALGAPRSALFWPNVGPPNLTFTNTPAGCPCVAPRLCALTHNGGAKAPVLPGAHPGLSA